MAWNSTPLPYFRFVPSVIHSHHFACLDLSFVKVYPALNDSTEDVLVLVRAKMINWDTEQKPLQ